MRIQWFLFFASAVAVLVCATPIPSPTNGGTNTNNQNLSRATTPPLSSSPPIVNEDSPYKKPLREKPLREAILTDEQKAAIESWENGMPSFLRPIHQAGLEKALKRGKEEGKDLEKVANGYKLRRMNDIRAKQLVKIRNPPLPRGRPKSKIDPKLMAEWETEVLEDKKRKEKYLEDLDRVERENKGDGGAAVERFKNVRYRADLRNKRTREKKREDNLKKGVKGKGKANPTTDAPAAGSAEGVEDDDDRMSFTFLSDTDSE